MKTMNQIVGGNLKKIRELSEFTQEQVAKSAGVERSAYSNYETGSREIPFNVLEKIANLFGCEPFLFFEDNAQSESEIMACAFRISDLEGNDLEEIAHFKDVVKSYIKMERISNDQAQ